MKKPTINSYGNLLDIDLLNILRRTNRYDLAQQVVDTLLSNWSERQEVTHNFFNSFFRGSTPDQELSIPESVFSQIRSGYLDLNENVLGYLAEINSLTNELKECKEACGRAERRIKLQYLANREYLTAAQLADMEVLDFPKTKRGISKIASKEGWPFRKNRARGGLVHEYEIAKLPPVRLLKIRLWREWEYTYD